MANKTMKTLTIGSTTYEIVDAAARADIQKLFASILPKVTTITLGTTWNEGDGIYYQNISLSCVTETSMVDLQPTPSQLASWQDEGLAFTTASGDGVVTVYVAGGLPTSSITVQVKVQEVMLV